MVLRYLLVVFSFVFLSTGLMAMDQAQKATRAKRALDQELRVGCLDVVKLYLSLEKLLQTYSPDILVSVLKDYFNRRPELVCMQNEDGNTVLHIVVAWKNKKMVELLLDAVGARALELVHMQNNDGHTVLDIAKGESNEVMTQLLMQYY